MECEHSHLVSYPCGSSGTKRVFSEISPLSHELHTEDNRSGQVDTVYDGPHLHTLQSIDD